jgi:hypothetical protein
MKLKIYTIYDDKACSFLTPFFAVNDSVALRQFSDLVNDSQSLVFKHSSDFALYSCGSFDMLSGLLIPLTSPESIVRASSLVSDVSSSAPISNVSRFDQLSAAAAKDG